jgi:lysozyme
MKKSSIVVRALLVVSIAVLLVGPMAAAAAPAETTNASVCSLRYTVRWGDTLASIANRFGTSVWSLANLNGIANINRIWPGMSLCVRTGSVVHGGGFWYQVRFGDTLNRIGARYGWSAWHLANVNHLVSINRIRVGQWLWIPGH